MSETTPEYVVPALTDERLAEIQARAEAATPGPWLAETSMTMDNGVHYAIRTREPLPEHPWSPRFVAWLTGSILTYLRPGERPQATYCDACRHMCYRGREVAIDFRTDPNTEADAAFLAHAREDVPALLAEIGRLEAKSARDLDDEWRFLSRIAAALEGDGFLAREPELMQEIWEAVRQLGAGRQEGEQG
jgi:hypothetical protein